MVPICRDIPELADDLLERRLTLRDWLGVKFHLSRCQACRNYVDQLRKTVALLRDPRLRVETPETEAARVRAAARRAEEGDAT